MQTVMSGPTVMTNEPATTLTTTMTDDAPVAATLAETNRGATATKNPYFKFGVGFLAWALWGHIPFRMEQRWP